MGQTRCCAAAAAALIVFIAGCAEAVTWDSDNGDGRSLNAGYFKSDILRSSRGFQYPLGAATQMADAHNFPALQGESLAMARIDFAPRGLNPPHSHPSCTSELMYVLRGSLLVGIVHPSMELILQQALHPGDLFLFPPGLLHFQLNERDDAPALALSVFDSQLPHTSAVAQQLFAANASSSVCS